jgi:hypothetical protein
MYILCSETGALKVYADPLQKWRGMALDQQLRSIGG